MNYTHLVLLLSGLLFSACSDSTPPVTPPVTPIVNMLQFKDISLLAGITTSGPSFGAGSWGDVNGDGFPDLWVGNHANQPNLYINNSDGTFTNAINQYWAGLPNADTHGAAWTDLNKDGALDLIELVGAQSGAGAGSNHVFMNIAGSFSDQALAKGLNYPLGRGRTPLPIDFNQDGNTDFVFSGFYRAGGATELFMQDSYAASFSPQASIQNMILPTQNHKSAQLADLNNDNHLDLIVNGYNFPHRIFDTLNLPMTAITKTLSLPITTGVQDVSFADFNNDLYTDVYIAAYPERRLSEVTQFSPTEVRFRLTNNGTQTKQLVFSSSATADFDLGGMPTSSIFIGATSQVPLGQIFSLNASASYAQGLAPLTTAGVYIGFNMTNQTWDVVAFNIAVHGITSSAAPITLISSSGLANPAPTSGRLFLNQGSNIFTEQTMPQTSGRSVVSGDFDNDMDIDLYIVESGTAKNKSNVLLLNDGQGVFQATASGADGSLEGIGDSVSVVDYDNDGYLDLFITNGEGLKPFTLRGPQQLFHNQGGSNHWLEIDLKGTTSQIEGVGAVVYVTAGGITQKREQNAGIHKNTQNHARLHFGLAKNTTIDSIKVLWPSGKTSTLNNIGTDQILQITEQ